MRQRSEKHFTPAQYDEQYREWKRSKWRERADACSPPTTLVLKRRINTELVNLWTVPAREYELQRKWFELQEFKKKYTPERFDEVYKRIWKPTGYSDFRRIDPELIYVKSTVTSQKVDIWGNVSEQEWTVQDPLAEDWDILRTLVSRHRNAGVIGKQHRYLVRDKGTKKYLGVICISVDMLEPAGRDAIIGWTKDQKKVTQPHCANGSTIVAIEPFSYAYNGGKLLALLCLSDQVAQRWADDVGKDGKHYRLVHVMTTSLFGNESKQTMYDNLKPFWLRTEKETSGQTPYELSPKLEQQSLDWLLHNEPRVFFDHFVAKKKDGSQKIRDPKDKAFKVIFSRFGFKPVDYMTGHKRGMYLAPLYDNAYAFLKTEIPEADLKPKFDNSISALTKEWKYGLPKANSGGKKRIDKLIADQRKAIKEGKEAKPLPTLRQPFWYRDLMDLTWKETKEEYCGE